MFSCLGRGSVCPPGSWSAARGSHWSARGCCYADGPMVHEARAGSALPRVGFFPLRPFFFFFHPLEAGPALSWGASPGGAAASLHRAQGGWFTCPTRSSSPSSLALLPLHRPGQRRGVRGLFYCIYLFIYLSLPEPVRVLCFNNFINSANLREGTGSFSCPPFSSPPPGPHQSLTGLWVPSKR